MHEDEEEKKSDGTRESRETLIQWRLGLSGRDGAAVSSVHSECIFLLCIFQYSCQRPHRHQAACAAQLSFSG